MKLNHLGGGLEDFNVQCLGAYLGMLKTTPHINTHTHTHTHTHLTLKEQQELIV